MRLYELLDEFPILYFNCIFNFSEKDLLRTIKINIKSKDDYVKLTVKGNINILNKKINFNNVDLNNDYKVRRRFEIL